MYSKATCRDMLLRMKSYVKLSPLASEFGIPQSKLSAFMCDESYMREISEERINDFLVFVQTRLNDLF